MYTYVHKSIWNTILKYSKCTNLFETANLYLATTSHLPESVCFKGCDCKGLLSVYCWVLRAVKDQTVVRNIIIL